ncbi:hypothetical protein I2494_02620 [Budviciaceae bacterium BWR-B9]|uniref:Uncharacterized protein n=1 Tax=Limnobaculum allomyrinae TaxID=2791986 RepID=A0ABS1ILJ8_9GAMM|nr:MULTISPECIES: hypothetical protein [Limnobaculum]MBK5142627.1 hypothetical protein [Limnobaculum allomyrinae]MBV7690487.1 hypothetical protein [Limnobaculum sp. M2-1]
MFFPFILQGDNTPVTTILTADRQHVADIFLTFLSENLDFKLTEMLSGGHVDVSQPHLDYLKINSLIQQLQGRVRNIKSLIPYQETTSNET